MRHRLAVDVGAVRRRHAIEAETSPGLLYTVRGERDATFAHKALRTRSLNWWDQNRESQRSHASANPGGTFRSFVSAVCAYGDEKKVTKRGDKEVKKKNESRGFHRFYIRRIVRRTRVRRKYRPDVFLPVEAQTQLCVCP